MTTTPQPALLEYVLEGSIQHPVVAPLAPPAPPWHLDEAVIQGQIMSNAVFPAFFVTPIKGEHGGDVVVDAAESFPLGGAVINGHGDESGVRIGRPLLAASFLLHAGTFGSGGRVEVKLDVRCRFSRVTRPRSPQGNNAR